MNRFIVGGLVELCGSVVFYALSFSVPAFASFSLFTAGMAMVLFLSGILVERKLRKQKVKKQ